MEKGHSTHILLTGGGTLGPVTPLISLYKVWKAQDSNLEASFVGTMHGPEKEIVDNLGIPFYRISAPKLSRHKKIAWIFIPVHFLFACLHSLLLLVKLKPDIVYTAGGYVSVPIVMMAWLMRIPVWVHQLDVRPGLANLLMAPFAKKISVTFQSSMEKFPKNKVVQVGGLVDVSDLGDGRVTEADKPAILIFGGGTGAQAINDAVEAVLQEIISDWRVVHLAGRGKVTNRLNELAEKYADYELHGLMPHEELLNLYDKSDLVICRAGLGTLLELIQYKKAAVLLPIPGTHQEDNAKIVEEAGAGKVLYNMKPQMLLQTVRELRENRVEREMLAKNMSQLLPLGGAEDIIEGSKEILKSW